jgi:hypothetical protein
VAATRNNQSKHNDSCREKIQTTQLVKRLQEHGLGRIELSAGQIKSIEILLKKTLPDLSSVQMAHDVSDKMAEFLADVSNKTRGLPGSG